ncbi:pseudouridylate synthase [Cystoisospora suis]|uniref:Pseudouridylate synthase n=1 Tax=Cystoisospora suis TaxID=483139 RepID=A0A2C6K9S2_9APIC|nr:pseudouridylate synthase [Cystoisospora suis]
MSMAPMASFLSIICSRAWRKAVCPFFPYDGTSSVVLSSVPWRRSYVLSVSTGSVRSSSNILIPPTCRAPFVSSENNAMSPVSLDLATSVSSSGPTGTSLSSFSTSASSSGDLVPLAKLCAEKSLCSRHEAEHFGALGLISVDGRPVESNRRVIYVHPNSRVELLPRAQRIMSAKVTIILNKPLHYLSCQVDRTMGGGRGKPLCRQLLVPENRWLDPWSSARTKGSGRGGGPKHLEPAACKKLVCAGRLDVDSTGLLVFTQDGRIASQLVGTASGGDRVGKEYHVEVDLPISAAAQSLLHHGLSLDGLELLPANIRLLPPLHDIQRRVSASSLVSSSPSSDSYSDSYGTVWAGRTTLMSIELFEGRHRQIRRMCELVGLRVLRIHRVRIGKLSLGGLPAGRWRLLLPHEKFA